MNDLTQDLAKLFVERGLAKELDVDIFYDFLPKEFEDIISINEYQGSGTATFTDTSVRSIQVLVRNRSNIKSRDLCWQLYDTMNTHNKLLQIGKVMAIISLRNTPFRLSADTLGRHRWVFNMGVTYNYKDWVSPTK